jgi:4-aminobutyrate aminotransferase-like enzyme
MPFTNNTRPKLYELNTGRAECFVGPGGEQVLDFCSQTLNLSFGHCHDAINSAVMESLHKIGFVSSRFGNEYVRRLVETLEELAPPVLSQVNVKVTSGTLANEGALKAAYKKRGRNGVVALVGSHHGQSLATMRVSGKNFGLAYVDRGGAHFVEPCTCPTAPEADELNRRCEGPCIDRIVQAIRANHPQLGAVILEPVMVDAGVVVLPGNYLQAVAEEARRFDVPLIFDEVQTAFGWTGHMFAANYLGVVPDALTACKGFAAGFPLAALLVTEGLDVLEYGEHEITHGAHPVCCAAALATLEALRDGAILESVRANGSYLQHALESLRRDFPFITSVRGLGHIWGLQIGDAGDGRITRFLMKRCLELGLLLRISKVGERSNILQIKPPLITPRESLQRGLDIFRVALAEVLAAERVAIAVPELAGTAAEAP